MEWKGTEDARYPKFLTTTPVDVPVKSEDNTTDNGTEASQKVEDHLGRMRLSISGFFMTFTILVAQRLPWWPVSVP